jgi:hypothetical protein
MQGIASGVNNTVGQLAGLLMIAVLPAVAGLSGQSFSDPVFADVCRATGCLTLVATRGLMIGWGGGCAPAVGGALAGPGG